RARNVTGVQTCALPIFGSVLTAAFLPVAHPFSVAPAKGTKQGDGFPLQVSLAGGEHWFKLAFLQLFRSHRRAAKGDGVIAVHLRSEERRVGKACTLRVS